MKASTFTYKGDDDLNVFVYKWMPSGKPKAIVQIVHGMAEHAERYADFAAHLNKAGYAVYADDHRGHGKTAGSLENTGYMGKDGWNKMVEDVHKLTGLIKDENPKIPVFLLGHSMGSFVSRQIASLYGNDYKGLVISGSGLQPIPLLEVARLISGTLSIFGGKKRSKLLDNMSFGAFNASFKPNRTAFDWLSRDNAQVDKYIADPYCGFVCTARMFYDMSKGLMFIFSKKAVDMIPKTLPIMIVSGEKDPVGNFSKALKKLYLMYKDAGIKDVSQKYYPEARHEIFNETNRKEVYQDVLDWVNNHM